jgi:hypothetical protein
MDSTVNTELENTMAPLTEPSTVLPTDADKKTTPSNLPRLTEIPIDNDNVALNVMVGFLDAAQKRGAYSLDESAKIWECIRRFIQKTDTETL